MAIAAFAVDRHYRREYLAAPRPGCHIAFHMRCEIWLDANNTKVYPNVEGDMIKSLRLFGFGADTDAKDGVALFDDPRFLDYRYVPGLTADDPSDLVLFYKTTKTKFACHSDRPSVWRFPFLVAKWVFAGPRHDGNEEGEGGSYWRDTPEFKRRLQKTLDFLRENKRPYWEKVVEENAEFLNSIPD